MPNRKEAIRKREERRARKESARHGFEYRPGAAKHTEEAKRLETGFMLLSMSEDGYDDDRNENS